MKRVRQRHSANNLEGECIDSLLIEKEVSDLKKQKIDAGRSNKKSPLIPTLESA